MRRLALPFVFLMTILFACQLQDLPPSPGVPGSSASPFGKATNVYELGYVEAETLSINQDELVFSAGESEKLVEASVVGEQYVYKIGYVLNVSDIVNPQWVDFKFNQPTVGLSNWIRGDANLQLRIKLSDLNIGETDAKKVLYIIAYACTKPNGGWDCHENRWMIRNLTAKLAEAAATETTGTVPGAPDAPVCTDLDGGQDYTMQGTVSGICLFCDPQAADSDTDICDTVVPDNVLEFYCADSTGYQRESVACPNGCTNGACNPVPTVVAPTTPTGLTAVGISTSEVEVTWNSVSGATGYNIYRSPQTTSGFVSIADNVQSPYTDAGLTIDTSYNYRVTAVNAGGESSQTSTFIAATMTNPPTGVTVTVTPDTKITLSWNPVPTGARSYTLKRSTSPTGPFSTLALGQTGTSFDDTFVTSGVTYYYHIITIGLATGATIATSLPSSTVSATIPIEAPPTPVLTYLAEGAPQLRARMTWPASSGATIYPLYRSEAGAAGPYAIYASIPSTPLSTFWYDFPFDSTSGIGLTTYYYKVGAINAEGGESISLPLLVKGCYSNADCPSGMRCWGYSGWAGGSGLCRPD